MQTDRNPRVLVVEDDVWMREALEAALGWPESQLEHGASAGTGRDAIELIRRGIDVDVALVDMGLPDMHGSDVIRLLAARCPTTTIVVFTVQEHRDVIVEAIRAGAHGYLLKSTTIQEVLDGLRAAARGGSPMTPSVARMVIEALRGGRDSDVPTDVERLTARETEVLTLLGKGLTYAEAATTLGIALGTVQGHVKIIYEKLRVNSKAEAATLAQRMGLL